MIRVLLVLLAVLVAILAFVLEQDWLYVAAGVPLVAVVVMVGYRLFTAYRSHQRRAAQSARRDETLETFGIFDVRPADARQGDAPNEDAPGEAPSSRKDILRDDVVGEPEPVDASSASETPPTQTPPESPPATAEEDVSSAEDSSEEDASPAEDLPDPATEDAPTADAPAEGPATADATTSDAPTSDATTSDNGEASPAPDAPAADPVLTPLLQSLRAAIDAHTVCLLAQEDVIPEYRILAIASASEDVHHDGSFATQDPLLTANMTRSPVTVRDVGDPDAVSDFLGYYRTPADVDHVALAPVERPDEPVTYFLLADATPDVDLGASRPSRVLERYARLTALVMETDGATDLKDMLFDGTTGGDGGETTTASEAAAAEREHAHHEDASDDGPRPRSEIIAEEMEAADRDGVDLSLVLVHLNRAEAIARTGEDAVESAEYQLRSYLEDAAPGHRVARFGELTYGVFYRGDVSDVEPWAVDVQHDLEQAPGELEGGASIGVAVRGPQHDTPESLRADATNALSEAYKTGACTIVE